MTNREIEGTLEQLTDNIWIRAAGRFSLLLFVPFILWFGTITYATIEADHLSAIILNESVKSIDARLLLLTGEIHGNMYSKTDAQKDIALQELRTSDLDKRLVRVENYTRLPGR